MVQARQHRGPHSGSTGEAATGEGRGGRQPREAPRLSVPCWLGPSESCPLGAHPQPRRNLSDFSQTSMSSPAPRCVESRLCSTSFLVIFCPVVFEGLVHCSFFSCKCPPPGCQCRWVWLVQSDSSLAPCHPSSCPACLGDGGAKAAVAQGPSGITTQSTSWACPAVRTERVLRGNSESWLLAQCCCVILGSCWPFLSFTCKTSPTIPSGSDILTASPPSPHPSPKGS